PALHLREYPDRERLPWERIEIDAVGIAFDAAESVRVGPCEYLLEDGLGLIEIVCRCDRGGDLLAVLRLVGKGGRVDDRFKQCRIGVRHRGDEFLRCGEGAAGMAVPKLLRQNMDEAYARRRPRAG